MTTLVVLSVVGALACAVLGPGLLLVLLRLLREDKPAVFVEDETADEVLEVDGPTSRPYIRAQGDPDEVIVPVGAKKHAAAHLHRLCIVAYADRRYSDICKTCTPRMGVRP